MSVKQSNTKAFLNAQSDPQTNRFVNGEIVQIRTEEVWYKAFYIGLDPWGQHCVVIYNDGEYNQVSNLNIKKL